MKRRNFLKAIGIGAVVAPAVVRAGIEDNYIIKPNGNLWVFGEQSTEIVMRDKLWYYKSGTYETLSIFTDKDMKVYSLNPLISDEDGVFPEIYMKEKSCRAVCQNHDGTGWDKEI